MAKAPTARPQANTPYMPKRGDRVTITLSGKEEPAVITKVTTQKLGVHLDSGREGTMPAYAAITGQIKPSDLPLPDHMKLKEVKEFKKGDRVEFDFKGNVVHGTVKKGGSKVQVIADGGKEQFGVDPRNLRPSSVPLPKDAPHPMDKWGLKGYSEPRGMSEETIAFTGDVTYNGVPVIAASNRGTGGCNSYYPLPKATQGIISKFHDDAKQWLADHGMPEDMIYEAADTWLTWKVTQQPYGVTAKALVEDWVKSTNEMRSQRDEAFSPFKP